MNAIEIGLSLRLKGNEFRKVPVSFSPGFSPVIDVGEEHNRFNGFCRFVELSLRLVVLTFSSIGKPLKRFKCMTWHSHRAKAR